MDSKIDTIKKIHYLKLSRGEDILPTLIQYCKKQSILSGVILGIGAVEKAVLGYFDLETKNYLQKRFDFNAEILNCTGNISKNAETNEYVIHCHMQIGDKDCNVYGGHLYPRTPISVTGEFIILETSLDLKRKTVPDLKLALLDLL